jgi:hypothetical protein
MFRIFPFCWAIEATFEVLGYISKELAVKWNAAVHGVTPAKLVIISTIQSNICGQR